MDSIRMVRIEDRLRLMIKLIFLFLLKFVLLLIWGASIWGIYTLLYDRYVLEAYPLRDYLPVLIFCFGNIWVLPWVILWYEKLYPVFDKPKMYYRVESMVHFFKRTIYRGYVYIQLYRFFNKVMSNNVWHYGCFSWFYFGWCYISYASTYDSWIDISLALKAFEHAYFISDTL